ncbi:hypothetical protein ACTFIT_007867 [Dictyostelium discoideum]
MEYRYNNISNNDNNNQKTKFQNSDKRDLLKSEFGFDDDEANEIIGSNEKDKYQDYNEDDDFLKEEDFNDDDETYDEDNDEDNDDDDYENKTSPSSSQNKNKKTENGINKNKLYISEKYFYSNDKSKDDEFIKKSLGTGKNYSEGSQNNTNNNNNGGEWREIDINDKNFSNAFEERVKSEEMKRQELSKKGITEVNGHYYSNDILIPSKFESYFLKPDEPISRNEKKYFAKLDALQSAKKEKLVSKRGFKYVDTEYDDSPLQTVVQSRLASKILQVLKESQMFENNININNNENNDDNNNNNDENNDDNIENFNIDFDFEENKNKNKTNFQNPNEIDQLSMDRIDPIISKADIELTGAVMSSDLRWVKIFWKRRNHSNINENSMKSKRHLKTVDQLIKDDDLIKIDSIQDTNLKNILNNTETNSAKQLIYDFHSKSDKSISISNIKSNNSNSKIISKVITTKTNNDNDDDDNDNNNNNNNNNDIIDPFNFGNNNLHMAENKKVKLEISINNNQDDNNNNNIQDNNINDEKREKLLLKRFSNKEFNDEENKEIEQLLKATPMKQVTNIPYSIESLLDTSDIVGPARHREIELKRRKKYRSLFFEVTDRDISHRLVKIKSRVRWIIGKKVKSKYVPDILFVKDQSEIKDETSQDLITNYIGPELRQLFYNKIKNEIKRKEKLKSKFSGLFNSNNNDNNDNNNDNSDDNNSSSKNINEEKVNSLLKDDEDDQVDLIGILREFPELLHDRVVQKYLRMERKKKKEQEEDQYQEQEEDQEQEQEQQNNTNTKQMFKDFNKDL